MSLNPYYFDYLRERGLTNDFEAYVIEIQTKEDHQEDIRRQTVATRDAETRQAYIDKLTDSELAKKCYRGKNVCTLIEQRIMSFLARCKNTDEIDVIKDYIKKDRKTRFNRVGGDESANFRQYYLRIYNYNFREYEDVDSLRPSPYNQAYLNDLLRSSST